MKPPQPVHALVTGGARGLGAAFVQALRDHHVQVDAPDRSELDLSSPSSIDQFTTGTSKYDILINNAGINVLSPLQNIDPALWQQMLQVNLTAALRLTQWVSGPMKENGWGRIINISSIFSLVTKEQRLAYSAVKSGLNGLTRSAAVELAPYNILVNAVCPGYVNTQLTRQNNSPANLARIAETIPMRRLAEPEEIARYVAWLCSPENSYLTGQTLVIDGGFTCL